ncbi:MAG TPA: hypothetical protein PLG66_08310, partial [Calditrichia bacterium]|nr:hypothetical protein [Calditrichia bacterium]
MGGSLGSGVRAVHQKLFSGCFPKEQGKGNAKRAKTPSKTLFIIQLTKQSNNPGFSHFEIARLDLKTVFPAAGDRERFADMGWDSLYS